ncbi:hypothetical protein WJX82_001631 [Trebouxia sp. C0006]
MGSRPIKVCICGLVARALCSIFLLPEAQGINSSAQRTAKIVVVPLPLSSHVAIHDAIIVEMLDRGHQVKLIYPENGTPRLRSQLLSHSNLTVEHYADFEPDLMLADFVLAGGSALADKLGIPKAIMVPFFGSGMMNNLFGSGASLLATVPQFTSRLPRHMNLLQRLQNLAVYVMNDIGFTFVLEAHLNKVIWRHYDIAPYSMSKSSQQAALILAGSDWAVSSSQPLSPHIVMFGAITAKSPRPLPPHLESFVGAAEEHGAVFASLGSTAIPEVPEIKAIAKALSAIAPTRAVWKLAKKDLELVGVNSSDLNLGDNILLSDWVPQNDLLGHPNIKAFFTQGGTNSFNEAAYHGVPIVGMPIFAEQPDTVAQAAYALPKTLTSRDCSRCAGACSLDKGGSVFAPLAS